jgi:hypothetical protein
MMNSEEYEQAYREAREALYRRGKRVGRPAPGREGLRVCNVNSTPLTDRELFTEAWGRALAEDILSLNRSVTLFGKNKGGKASGVTTVQAAALSPISAAK